MTRERTSAIAGEVGQVDRSTGQAILTARNHASRLPSGPILIATCAGAVPDENAPVATPPPTRLPAAGQHTRPPRVRCRAHRTTCRWRAHGSHRSPGRRTSTGSRSRSSSQHSHQHMTLRSRICDSISPIPSRSVHLHRVARTSSLASAPGPTGAFSSSARPACCWLFWSSSGSLWSPRPANRGVVAQSAVSGRERAPRIPTLAEWPISLVEIPAGSTLRAKSGSEPGSDPGSCP